MVVSTSSRGGGICRLADRLDVQGFTKEFRLRLGKFVDILRSLLQPLAERKTPTKYSPNHGRFL